MVKIQVNFNTYYRLEPRKTSKPKQKLGLGNGLSNRNQVCEFASSTFLSKTFVRKFSELFHRKNSMVSKAMEPESLHLNPSSAIYELCDQGQVT